MAFFSKKTTEKKDQTLATPAAKPAKVVRETKKEVKSKTKTAVAVVGAGAAASANAQANSVIIRPRITEKAGTVAEKFNAYSFEVYYSANKKSIANAINAMYKVKPTKVRIVNLKSKAVFVRGKHGQQSGVKKAIVTLKKGDKIELI